MKNSNSNYTSRLVVIIILIMLNHIPLLAMEDMECNVGKPFMTVYTAKEYAGDYQNWSIVQDHRGVIYVGNSPGILEFDGVLWRMIPNKNKSLVRSLDIDENGRIYAGCSAEFGYLAPDSIGKMQYVSLLDFIKPEDKVFGYVWSTNATPDGVYFTGFERMFCFKQKGNEWKIKIWRAANGNRFMYSFYVGNRFFVQQSGVGLTELIDDSLHLVPGGEQFADERLQVLLPFDENSKNGTIKNFLIGTFNRGLFLYNGNYVQPFKTEVDEFLHDNTLYTGAILSDGTVGLATLNGGFIIINRKGDFLRHINQDTGLPTNAVLKVFVDRVGMVWLLTENGIIHLEIPSPLSIFEDGYGLNGPIINIKKHQNVLYVATSNGIFYLDEPSNTFKLIPGLLKGNRQAFYFTSVNKTLLAAVSTGIYEVKNKRAFIVKREQGSLGYSPQALHQSKQQSNRVFVGLLDGLASIYWNSNSGKWIDEGRISGVNEYVIEILEPEPGVLWLGTNGRGVLRVSFDKNVLTEPIIEHFNSEHGLPNNGGISIYNVFNQIIFGTSDGAFRFDEDNRKFVPDTLLNQISFGGSTPVNKAIAEDNLGNVWIDFGAEKAVALKQPGNSYYIEKMLFKRFEDFGACTIYPEDNGVVWFGSLKGLIRYDTNIKKMYTVDYKTLIRQVKVGNDSLIFGGTSKKRDFDLSENKKNKWKNVIKYSDNAVRFEYAATSYEKSSETKFQSWLEGFDENWSQWSNEYFRTYTNLPEGDYRFHVKAKNLYGHESFEDVYDFKILPPWYRTWRAYFYYIFVLIIGIFAVDRFQRTRLIRKEEEKTRVALLEVENKRKSDELEEARKLQLSMLPKQLPELPNLDIAVYMKTATEVGGDYYDFCTSPDGTLTIAIGDATGHGLKAGSMVSLTKGLFWAEGIEMEAKDLFQKCTKTIKHMNLGNLYMALLLIKIKDNEMTISAAGMPPVYVYRAQNCKVEEIILKGMPLGAFIDYNYQKKTVPLNKGDAVLFQTDGLAELFNDNQEMFDYKQISNIFKEVATQKPNEIIDKLINSGQDWCDCVPTHDDITFVVLKVK